MGVARQGRLRIGFTTRQVFGQELQQADSLLLAEADEIHARRIFVDGLRRPTFDVGGRGEGFQMLAEGLHREQLTAMLALEVAAGELSRRAAQAPEAFISDTIVCASSAGRRPGGRWCVEQHAGTVRAESAGVGKGATFTVTVPALGGDSAGDAGRPGA